MRDPVARVAAVSILGILATGVGAALGPLPAAILGGLAGLVIFGTCCLVNRQMRRDAGL